MPVFLLVEMREVVFKNQYRWIIRHVVVCSR